MRAPSPKVAGAFLFPHVPLPLRAAAPPFLLLYGVDEASSLHSVRFKVSLVRRTPRGDGDLPQQPPCTAHGESPGAGWDPRGC